MAISTVLRRPAGFLIFEGTWVVVGLASLAVGAAKLIETSFSEFGTEKSYWILVVFAVLAFSVAASHASQRLFRLTGTVTGLLLGLYGLALILLGTEDVGGLRVSLPWGLSAIALAGWTIFRVILTLPERSDAA
jgi:hypothetical protein